MPCADGSRKGRRVTLPPFRWVVRGAGTMSVAGDTQPVGEGDLILVPPATDHSIANDGEGELACVSVQSPPVAVAELYGDQMAEVSGYEDDEGP